MVSSGTIAANAQEITSAMNNYLSVISDLSSSWKGMSYDNLSSKGEEFISEFNSAIIHQMESFTLAVELYDKYKQTKENWRIAAANYGTAVENKDNAAATRYYNLCLQYKSNLDSYTSQINSALQSASSPQLEATSLNPSTSSSGGGKGEFVNYYQYNYSEPYSQGTIATSGCGPTSLAMVLTYLLGEEITPVEMAAKGNGTYTCSEGTYWSYFGDMAEQYGVNCEQMGVSTSNIVDNLKEGKTLIMSMGPGHFTSGGHFIVVRGLTEDGQLIVADPNSEERSNQTWDVSILVNEGCQIWALSN